MPSAEARARRPLDAGWSFARLDPGACDDPRKLPHDLEWRAAPVPGTVAQALGAEAALATDLEASDWWYRVRFTAPAQAEGEAILAFDGLATLATAWLDGERVLESRNMHRRHRVAVALRPGASHELAIRFAALAPALEARVAPRARWRTALVGPQNLRGVRTSFLGRMPGWMPPLPAVGPWRDVWLEAGDAPRLEDCRVSFRLEGGEGRVQVRARLAARGGVPVPVTLRVDGVAHALPVDPASGAIEAEARVPDPPLWWPHTHGEPRRVPWSIVAEVDGAEVSLDEGLGGFRHVVLEQGSEATRLLVNGVPVFARGACWTPGDATSPGAPAAAVQAAVALAREAGANMLRVGGTMAYEGEAFLAACDAAGVMVWQDFMFANFDYPFADAAFRAEVEAEAHDVLARLARHPCVVVHCGGSEVAQQAAMMGQEADRWLPDFIARDLPAICAARHPGVAWVPNSPWGGPLPFHVGQGIAHYYGVGAYRRPFADLRTSRVRFATECLAFAHVPEPAATRAAFGTEAPPPHAPSWKARVPRDPGSGWDFEDVRDHYLQVLFGVEPAALRAEDLPRYHALSRRVPGEVMRRAYGEWRRAGSPCGGALVWLWRDLALAPGAGWGVVDAHGHPKAAWWALRRAWAPRALFLTDEGLDGLDAHLVNDTAGAVEGTLEFLAFRHGRAALAPARRAVRIEARSALRVPMDAVVGHFTDSTHAYRFGAPKADTIAARWLDARGATIGEDFHFPLGLAEPAAAGEAPSVALVASSADAIEVEVSGTRLLVSVSLDADGWRPEDNYFHLLPGVPRRIRLHATGTACGAELRVASAHGSEARLPLPA